MTDPLECAEATDAIRPAAVHEQYQQLLRADVATLYQDARQWPLRTCPLCAEGEGLLHWERPPLVYRRCAACELVFLNPLPPESVLATYFATAPSATYFHQVVLSQSAARRQALLFTPRIALLGQLVPTPARRSLLDIGCAIGTFLAAAVTAGWQAAGLEPNQSAAKLACDAGLRVATAVGAPPVTWQSGTFSVISGWEVIAHLIDPVASLQAVLPYLADDGLLVLTTPNADGLEYRLLGAAHENVSFPFLQFFSPRTLQQLFARLHLTVERLETPGTMDLENLRAHYRHVDRAGWPPAVESLLFSETESARRLRTECQAAVARALASGHMLGVARKAKC
ncbi:MAG: class I SAM-dependent methyltransferase [Deltaproteobacteria bacterium]|nr:class I SAM-dependent methyltransferase [Deltaproteobacteria bacterium]